MSGRVHVTRLLTDDAMAEVAALGIPVIARREDPTREELCDPPLTPV